MFRCPCINDIPNYLISNFILFIYFLFFIFSFYFGIGMYGPVIMYIRSVSVMINYLLRDRAHTYHTRLSARLTKLKLNPTRGPF